MVKSTKYGGYYNDPVPVQYGPVMNPYSQQNLRPTGILDTLLGTSPPQQMPVQPGYGQIPGPVSPYGQQMSPYGQQMSGPVSPYGQHMLNQVPGQAKLWGARTRGQARTRYGGLNRTRGYGRTRGQTRGQTRGYSRGQTRGYGRTRYGGRRGGSHMTYKSGSGSVTR
jgi:hypothetical protein